MTIDERIAKFEANIKRLTEEIIKNEESNDGSLDWVDANRADCIERDRMTDELCQLLSMKEEGVE